MWGLDLGQGGIRIMRDGRVGAGSCWAGARWFQIWRSGVTDTDSEWTRLSRAGWASRPTIPSLKMETALQHTYKAWHRNTA